MSTLSVSLHGKKRHPTATTMTNKRLLGSKKAPLSKRRRTAKASRYNSPEGSDESNTKKPLTAAEIEMYEKFIVPERRPLTKHDKEISALNDRALKAFQEKDQRLFVKIISETMSLYVRDDAVRLAAEVGWIKVAEQLLIRETSDIYEYPVWPAPLSIEFVSLSNNCAVRGSKGRWLLKTAVLSAVKKNREVIFNLLAPVAGISFIDVCSGDLFDNITNSQMDSNVKKKWVRLIAGYVDEKASRSLLENAIYHCAEYQLVERLPYLLKCLSLAKKAPSHTTMAALSVAIEEHHQKVARYIIDGLKKAAIPIDLTSMYAAEEAEDIKMIEYLCQNGCNSFPLELYGKNPALSLRRLLLKNNREELYHLIISE